MRIKFRGSINNKCVINIDQTLYYIPKTAKSCYIMYGYKYINKCIRPTSWHFLCDRFQEVLGSHVDDPFVLHWSKLQKPHLSVRGWRLFLLWILLKLISKVLWQSLSGVITLFFICLAHAHVAVLQCTLIRWAGQILSGNKVDICIPLIFTTASSSSCLMSQNGYKLLPSKHCNKLWS